MIRSPAKLATYDGLGLLLAYASYASGFISHLLSQIDDRLCYTNIVVAWRAFAARCVFANNNFKRE